MVRRVMGGWANHERVRAELASKGARITLMRLAMRYVSNDTDAEDLVHQAIAKVLDPEGAPWVPEEKTFVRHVGSILNRIGANATQSARTRREVLAEVDDDDWDRRGSSPTLESALDGARASQTLREKGQRLLDLLDPRDEVGLRVFHAVRAGCESVDEQATWIGCTVEAVLAAHKRLKYRAQSVRDEWHAAEEQRMKQRRAQAGRKGGRR
jgi:DNA-directed RNA polymerase specialized sigma24 family protein